MNVGLNEVPISPSESPHGAGLTKSSKEITVAGQSPLSFASRLKELHEPVTSSPIRKPDLTLARPTITVSIPAPSPVASETTVPIGSCDDHMLPTEDMHSSSSSNQIVSPKQRDTLSSIIKSAASPSITKVISSTSDGSTTSKHPLRAIRLDTKQNETGKQAIANSAGQLHEVIHPTAISSGGVISPLLFNVRINEMQPQMPEPEQTTDTIRPVSSGAKGNLAKDKVNASVKTPGPAIGMPAMALQHPVVSGSALISQDVRPEGANQDLLFVKKAEVEGPVVIGSFATPSSVPLVGGIPFSPIKVIEQTSNATLLESPLREHHVDATTPSVDTRGYGGDGATHAVLLASNTALEVGLQNGSHGWVKIRAEMDGGGLVHATLSARSTGGQEMLHRELPGLTRFLETEHVAVLPFVADHSVTTSPASGQGSHDRAPDAQSDSQQKRINLGGLRDSSVSVSDGVEQHNTLTDGIADTGTLLRGNGSGSWLNVRV